MKRKALLISLLLLIPIALQARVTYQPTLSLSAGGTFTQKVEDMMRSSYMLKAELDPLSIQFNHRHTISLPIYFSYVSRTPYAGGYCLNSHMDFGAGVSYRFTFNDFASLRTIADINLRYIREVHGGIFSFGLTAEPWFQICDEIAFIVPLRIGVTKGEVSLSPSVGICVIPLGGIK